MERFPRWLGVVILYYLLKLQTIQAFDVTDVRLVGGSVPWEGRVEINADGVWGTVCDDGWDLLDAHVFCRMLGYPKGATHAWPEAHFGAGSGTILADDVSCTGNETNIMQCPFRQGEGHDCTSSEDSSLKCDAFNVTDVRLVGGSVPWEGRVEILADEVWGTVCDDNWDLADAHVFCRMLGYPKGATNAWPAAHFGSGSGTILVDELSCTGNETNIMQCPFRQGEGHDCSSSEDSSLKCDAFDVTDVRLVGGSAPWEGRVEINADGVWGTVCDGGWDLLDAHVICRMLGYPKGATHAWPDAHFGSGSGTILADELSCTGTETSIMQCPFRQGEGHTCSSSDDSSLECDADVRCPYIWELPDVSQFIMSKTEEGQSNYTIIDSMTSLSAILCTRMCSAHARKYCGEYNECSMVKYDDVTRTCSLYHKTNAASPVVCDASSPCFLNKDMF